MGQTDSEHTASLPLNELETTLAALLNGEITQEDFLRQFLGADLYIMVDGEPVGETLGDKKPMVIAASESSPRLIAVFSDPVRARRMVELFSDYSFPILVNCGWVLEHIGPHMGIAFNPGCENGFELAPEGAQQLKDALAKARTNTGE